MWRGMWALMTLVILAAPSVGAAMGMVGDAPPPPTLTVSGDAEVRVAPDLAQLRMGTTVQAKTAADAQQQVSKVMTDAMAAVRKLGIPREDVQTARVQLQPVYAGHNLKGKDEPRIVGYRASNVVSARVLDLAKVGDVIDAGVGAGANEVHAISFELEDDTAAREEALRQAVAKARAKAHAIAEALGVTLTGVRAVREGGTEVRPFEQANMMHAVAGGKGGTPIQAGQVTVEASVTVEYRLGGAGVAAD